MRPFSDRVLVHRFALPSTIRVIEALASSTHEGHALDAQRLFSAAVARGVVALRDSVRTEPPTDSIARMTLDLCNWSPSMSVLAVRHALAGESAVQPSRAAPDEQDLAGSPQARSIVFRIRCQQDQAGQHCSETVAAIQVTMVDLPQNKTVWMEGWAITATCSLLRQDTLRTEFSDWQCNIEGSGEDCAAITVTQSAGSSW